MKIIIPNIRLHEVLNDLDQSKAKKMNDSNIMIETFDLPKGKSFHLSPFPPKFQTIFYVIQLATQNGHTLLDRKLRLYIKETEENAEINLQLLAPEQEKINKITIKFPVAELANIEDLLLQGGLELQKRYEIRKITYFYYPLKATFQIVDIVGTSPFVQIEAHNEISTIQALSLIGFSISQSHSPFSTEKLKEYKDLLEEES